MSARESIRSGVSTHRSGSSDTLASVTIDDKGDKYKKIAKKLTQDKEKLKQKMEKLVEKVENYTAQKQEEVEKMQEYYEEKMEELKEEKETYIDRIRELEQQKTSILLNLEKLKKSNNKDSEVSSSSISDHKDIKLRELQVEKNNLVNQLRELGVNLTNLQKQKEALIEQQSNINKSMEEKYIINLENIRRDYERKIELVSKDYNTKNDAITKELTNKIDTVIYEKNKIVELITHNYNTRLEKERQGRLELEKELNHIKIDISNNERIKQNIKDTYDCIIAQNNNAFKVDLEEKSQVINELKLEKDKIAGELYEINKDLLQKINILRENLKKLQESNLMLTNKYNTELLEYKESVKKDIETNNETIRKISYDNKILLNTIKEVEEKIKQKSLEYENERSRVHDIHKKDITSRDLIITDLRNEIKRLMEEITNISSKYDASNKNYQEQKCHLEQTTKKELHEKDIIINNLKYSNINLSDIIKHLTDKYNKLNSCYRSDKAGLEQRCDELQKSVNSYQKENDLIKTELIEKREMLQATVQKLSEINIQKEINDNKISSLTLELKNNNENLNNLNKHIESLTKDIINYKHTINCLTGKLTAEECQKNFLSSKLKTFQEELKKREEEFVSNKIEITKMISLEKSYIEKIQTLTDNLSRTKIELEEKTRELANRTKIIQSGHTGLNRIITSLTADNKSKTKEVEELKERLRLSQIDVESLKGRLDKQLQDHIEENNILANKNNILKKILSDNKIEFNDE